MEPHWVAAYINMYKKKYIILIVMAIEHQVK